MLKRWPVGWKEETEMAVSTINILIICVTLIVLVAISNKKKK